MQILNQGVIVPVVTPRNQTEILNVLDYLKKGGVKTIFLLGTTGEAAKISLKDKLKLIHLVSDYLKDDMQWLVGISTPNIKQSAELMQVAYEAGATASFVSPLMMGQDIMSVVHTLLKTCPGNLFLYNYPALTKEEFIPIADIEKLLNEPRILGIKDSSADFDYFKQLVALKKQQPHFKVYYGAEKNLSEAFLLDIDGFVCGTGNVAPELAIKLWEEKENGPWQAWYQIKEQTKKKDPSYILALKAALRKRGVISDDCGLKE